MEKKKFESYKCKHCHSVVDEILCVFCDEPERLHQGSIQSCPNSAYFRGEKLTFWKPKTFKKED